MLMGYAEGSTVRSAPRRLCIQDDQWCNRVRVLHVVGVLASGSALLSLSSGACAVDFLRRSACGGVSCGGACGTERGEQSAL